MGTRSITPVSVIDVQDAPIVSTVYVYVLVDVALTFTVGVPEIVIRLSVIDQFSPGGRPNTRAARAPPPNS